MIQLDKESISVMMEAGYIMIGMQRFDQARKVFDGLVALAPDNDIPLVARGSVEFCEGHFEKAIDFYHQALKVNPESLYAKAYIGESLFFKGDKEKAISFLEGVMAKDAGDPAAGFAKALLEAIHKGYTPRGLASLDEIEAAAKNRGV